MRPRHPYPGTAVAKVARSPRTPTDEDKGRFGFLLPLLVKGRSIRSRAPIPSRARKEARAPGRGLVDQDQGQEQEHDWPRPSARFLRRLLDRDAGR